MVDIEMQPRNRKIIDVLQSIDDVSSAVTTKTNTFSDNETKATRTSPFISQSEVIASAPADGANNGLASHSWPNIIKDGGGRSKSIARKTSHPFLLTARGKNPRSRTFETVVSEVLNKAYGAVTLLLRCSWECSSMLVQEVTALVTMVGSVFQAPPKADKEKLRCAGVRYERTDDQELINLMENQTQTLLEINKFLREELATVKEEREVAEKMISRIEQKCRDAVGKQCEHVSTHSIFHLLYGGGASQAAFEAGSIDLNHQARSVIAKNEEVPAVGLQVYGPINRPVSWVKFTN